MSQTGVGVGGSTGQIVCPEVEKGQRAKNSSVRMGREGKKNHSPRDRGEVGDQRLQGRRGGRRQA